MADLEVHLLDENEQWSGLVDGCPGCKAVLFVREKNGFPKKLLLLLANMMLCNSLTIAVIFPFLYFMIQDFHVAKSDDEIGFYAGWIGSSFMAGRAITAVLWGTIADTYGRKPVIFCGIMSIVVFNTLFGLSKSFWTAFVTRLLLGGFNGMLGTLTAYATEICSKEHVSFSVSLISTMWGLGLIIGPALGGYLSQPALKYPSVFKATIFDSFPYFLQALVISVYAFAVLFSLFQIPETLHKHPVSLVTDGKADLEVAKVPLLRNRALLSSILVYCLWAFHEIAYTETFSLWAVSPKQTGGLGWTSSDVGEVLAVSGLSLLIFQLTIFPSLVNMIGPIALARVTISVSIPLLTVYPFLTQLHGGRLRVVVILVSALKACLSAAASTASFLLVNNSIERSQRGAANGLSLSVVSVFRALGPAVGGSIFSFAQTRLDAPFLPGDQLLFFFLGSAAFVSLLSTFPPVLPLSTKKPVEEF